MRQVRDVDAGERGARGRDVAAARVLAARSGGEGDVVLLGVRHHGPGSARAVRAALEAYRPQAVLIEGPAEADALAGFAADPRLRPPVALLAHVVDDPARAAFWPFADFSPEWVALRWAVEAGAEVRFIDLPAAHTLALRPEADHAPGPEPEGPDGEAGPGPDAAAGVRVDPLAVLARTAGHDDPERWWEDAVEHRGAGEGAEPDPLAPFAAVAEAMAEVRAVHGDGGDPFDPVREAHMRLRVREARRTYERTAVVCGAWHVPALAERQPVAVDRQLAKGLPKVKVGTTWVPWTHRRLARAGGYGAGIDSPGWYRHLFTAPDRPVTRWMTKVAGLLREEDVPVSSAHVIEAVRLAETLAALRGRPLAGLGEATDAVRAVMCEGSDVPMALVRDRLVVGDALGEVPPDAPAVPLARDLARQQRTLRLRPEAQERRLALDLRRDTDAARSRLLHRLALLGVGWGEPAGGRESRGTFREDWTLRWEPELAVRVAEAGIWGTTVESAAAARAADSAVHAGTLAEVTATAESCLLAGLADTLPVVMRVLADRAALDTDVAHLAAALPALVRAVRYGDVRGTDAGALGEVARGVALRVCVGLPPACAGLDADGAAQMRTHLDAVHRAVALLPDPELKDRWAAVLGAFAEGAGGIPGLLRGAAARLLLDDGRLGTDRAARLMGLALSPGTPPLEAAGWVEGFLAGGGMLLVHDARLLSLVDGWLCGVPPDAFMGVLPLLRRTFAEFEPGVRRTLGDLARRGPATPRSPAPTAEPGVPGFDRTLDPARANAGAHTARLLLGTTTTTDLLTWPAPEVPRE
jgi:hypothetical protein